MLAEATLTPESYGPLLERLDSGPATVRELISEPKIAAMGLANLRQHLLVLNAQRTCQIALPLQGEDERRRSTDAFNRTIISYARQGSNFGFLASPVTGDGIAVDQNSQLALLAMQQGIQDRSAYILSVLRDDQIAAGETAGELGARSRAAIDESLANFDSKLLPVLKRLKIC